VAERLADAGKQVVIAGLGGLPSLRRPWPLHTADRSLRRPRRSGSSGGVRGSVSVVLRPRRGRTAGAGSH
jgi:hypothetical protein